MGSLAVTYLTQTGGSFNLATLGPTDWIHYATTTPVQKSGGGVIILSASGALATYTDDFRTFSWSGGTPTASGSDTNGAYLTLGNFTITVPASTSVQTLHVWCGVHNSQARLVATLSDGSAPVYRSRRMGEYSASAAVQFALAFAANSGGQTLTVTWTEEPGGNPGRNAALASVALASGDTRPAPGTGVLTLGQTSAGNGTTALNGPAYFVNLTDAGSADWVQVHNGLSSLNRKSGGGSQIALTTVIGGDNIYSGDGRMLTWTDGTPTAASAENNGSYVLGPEGHGFQITVPADTTQRRVILFCGAYKAYGQLIASLSDGSAPTVYSLQSGDLGGPTGSLFTVVYKAASASQTLTMRWLDALDSGGGNVTLCGVALATYPSLWYPIARTAGSSAAGATVTSPSVNTIGATQLIACVGSQNGASSAFSDSLSNTWTKVKSYTNLGVTGQTIEVWTAPATSTGPAHTITATCPAGSNPTVAFVAYANATAPPFNQSSAGGAGVLSSLQPGTLTPGGNDALVVCFAVSAGAYEQSITSSYLQEAQGTGSGSSLAGMLSERIMPTPTALNPTITLNTTPSHVWAAQVSFAIPVAVVTQETSTTYVLN